MGNAPSSDVLAPRFEWRDGGDFWSFEIADALKNPPLTIKQLLCSWVPEDKGQKLKTMDKVIDWVVKKNRLTTAIFHNVDLSKIGGWEYLRLLPCVTNLKFVNASGQLPYDLLPTNIKNFSFSVSPDAAAQLNEPTLWKWLHSCDALEELALGVTFTPESFPILDAPNLEVLADLSARVKLLELDDAFVRKNIWSSPHLCREPQDAIILRCKSFDNVRSTSMVPEIICRSADALQVQRFVKLVVPDVPEGNDQKTTPFRLTIDPQYPFDAAVVDSLVAQGLSSDGELRLELSSLEPPSHTIDLSKWRCVHVWKAPDYFCEWLADALRSPESSLKEVSSAYRAEISDRGRSMLVRALDQLPRQANIGDKPCIDLPSRWMVLSTREQEERIKRDAELAEKARRRDQQETNWQFAHIRPQYVIEQALNRWSSFLTSYKGADCFRTAFRTCLEDAAFTGRFVTRQFSELCSQPNDFEERLCKLEEGTAAATKDKKLLGLRFDPAGADQLHWRVAFDKPANDPLLVSWTLSRDQHTKLVVLFQQLAEQDAKHKASAPV